MHPAQCTGGGWFTAAHGGNVTNKNRGAIPFGLAPVYHFSSYKLWNEVIMDQGKVTTNRKQSYYSLRLDPLLWNFWAITRHKHWSEAMLAHKVKAGFRFWPNQHCFMVSRAPNKHWPMCMVTHFNKVYWVKIWRL